MKTAPAFATALLVLSLGAPLVARAQDAAPAASPAWTAAQRAAILDQTRTLRLVRCTSARCTRRPRRRAR